MFKGQEDADKKAFDKSELIEIFRASDDSCTKSIKMGNGDMKTKCVTKQLTRSIQLVLSVKCVRRQFTC